MLVFLVFARRVTFLRMLWLLQAPAWAMVAVALWPVRGAGARAAAPRFVAGGVTGSADAESRHGPADGWKIRVRFEDGEPAVGALLESLSDSDELDLRAVAARMRARTLRRGSERHFLYPKPVHQSVWTYSDGAARVPALGGSHVVVGRAERDGQRFVGSLDIVQARSNGAMELVLGQAGHLRVRVKHSHGRPAQGVHVWVRGAASRSTPSDARPPRHPNAAVLSTGRTDSDR